MTVLQNDRLNPRFTIYLSAEGKPVQRTLDEMTAAEVVLALEFQAALVERLEVEADAAREISKAISAGRIPAHLTASDVDRGISAMREFAEEAQRDAQLMQLVVRAIPQWDRHPSMKMRDAVRRFWPRGKAA